MNRKLGLVIVILLGLVVLSPTKGQTIAAPPLTNPIIDSSESQNSEVTTGEMVFIPAGEFQMGCDLNNTSEENCQESELPLHPVDLDAYYIDKYEVTNILYRQCETDGICSPPYDTGTWTRSSYYDNPVYSNFPVVFILWSQAHTFCNWAGKRLPTEAEWEKAARGTSDTRKYPWGNQDGDCSLANSGMCTGDTVEVGSYQSGASPYGVMDMAGNVYEWVNDWYDDVYYSVSPYKNPTGPVIGTNKGVRGGPFDFNFYFSRIAKRSTYSPEGQHGPIGFRCAASTNVSSRFLDLPFDYSGDHSNALLDAGPPGGSIEAWFDHNFPTPEVDHGNGELELFTGILNSENSVVVPKGDYTCYKHSGIQYCYDDHNGYDFRLVENLDVRAADGGIVEFISCGDYGNQVIIDHGNGYLTLYGHLASFEPGLANGDSVSRGEIIGTAGGTGFKCNYSFPTHLHFGVYKDNNQNGLLDESVDTPTDPQGYLPIDPTGTTSYPWLWVFDRKAQSNFQGIAGSSFNDPSGKINVVVPPGYFDGDVTLELFREPQIAGASASLSTVGYSFWLRLLQLVEGTQQQSQSLSSDSLAAPSDPIDITISYSDEAVLHQDENNLVLYRWDEVDEEWLPLPSIVDTLNNQVTAQTTELGHFDLQAPLLCSGDAFTSDDDYYGAVPLSVNSPPVNRLFDVIEDEDWFSFKGIASADYTFQTDNLADGVDTIIEIYDIDGLTQLSFDDNSGEGFASKIEWTAPATGIYYLRLSQKSGSSYGCDASYQVSVEGDTLLFLPLTLRK